MQDLIDVIDINEQVVYELDLTMTVMGEVIDYFEEGGRCSREDLKYHANKIFHMLLISNKYIYENKDRLEEAVKALYQLKGEKNG
ncbi:MAG: hypothetical protein E7453_06050 [Ruminococcaceae bacterium]|nr:hypothetical protein [Oscillospiraceae bacterium]